MTLEQLQKLFPDATAETWHQHPNGGGWVQNTAKADTSCRVGVDCLVFGNARVYGNAWGLSPLQIMGTKHFVNVSAYGMLQVGCIKGSIDWWKEHYRAVGWKEGYSAAQVKEYRNYIELARVWMKINKCDVPTEGK